MGFDSTWQFLGGIAIGLAVIGSLCLRAAASYVLERWGRSTKGAVVRSVEKNDDGGVVYVVSYEFTATSTSGAPQIQAGKQTTRYSFRARDIVAVRYWPKWPRLNRIAERAV